MYKEMDRAESQWDVEEKKDYQAWGKYVGHSPNGAWTVFGAMTF